MKKIIGIFFLVLACSSLKLSDKSSSPIIPRACDTEEHKKFKFCNVSLSLDERIYDLINQLKLDEKPYLLTARASPLGNIDRLGVPEYDWGGNCVHGVQSRCGGSKFTMCPTSFPNPNGLGATFNKSVWQGMGNTIGVELRALWLLNAGENRAENLPHIGLDCWSPNINLVRDPRWGRNLETPGEDPLVNGLFAKYYSLGLQNGSDPRYLLGVATLKHFAANSLEGNWDQDGKWNKQGKINRHTVDSKISDYDLYSSYFQGFRIAVQEGNAMGVMCSYNSINGVPACADKWLLNQVLRKQWGFKGYITSDTGAVDDIQTNHKYADTPEKAISYSYSATCDIESAAKSPSHSTIGEYIQYTKSAIEKSLLTEDSVNKALYNALKIRFQLGLFDPIEDQPYWNISPDVIRSKQHEQLAMESTSQSFVLLKNKNGILPLDKAKKTAVVGPLSTAKKEMLGNYLGQICPGEIYDKFDCVESPLEAIKRFVANDKLVNYAAGLSSVTETSTFGFLEAVKVAQEADQVIVFVGTDLSVEKEGLDRDQIVLPGAQKSLIQTLSAVNKNIVVVLMNGGIIAVDNFMDDALGIIETFFPGFYGGYQITRTLFGEINEFGKMPTTIYSSSYPTEVNMLDFQMTPHDKSPGRTYKYFTGKPIFTYGHGLSYTTFKVQLLEIGYYEYSVQVTNTGKVQGDDVIMGFFTPLSIPSQYSASQIKFQLFDFERVRLIPGEKVIIKLGLSKERLTLFDNQGNEQIFDGQYTISISDSGLTDPNIQFNINISSKFFEKLSE